MGLCKKLKIMEKEREKIKLNNSQWRDLVQENYLTDETKKEIEIHVIEDNYDGSGRHTEDHHLIFQRLSDEKFFKVNYETSVKDEMGWEECNYGSTEAVEVFPKTINKVIYE
jgi:hypothetical protein